MVMLQPPICWSWKQKMCRSGRHCCLKFDNGVVAVGGIMARITSVPIGREMGGGPVRNAEHGVVALADNDDRRARLGRFGGQVDDVLDDRLVERVVAPLVGLPLDSPLALEVGAV